MIIKDLNHTRYELTKTELRELPECRLSRYVILREFAEGIKRKSNYVPVRYKGNPVDALLLGNRAPINYVGCREFSPTNYRKIMKAVEEAK